MIWHSFEASANHLPEAHSKQRDRRNYMATKVRPLHDRVIVRRLDEEEKTAGGIIIPDSAKEKPIQGEVIAAGKGKILENGDVRPLDVKKGDRVIFSKYAGTDIKLDGQDYLMMREDDILGVVESK